MKNLALRQPVVVALFSILFIALVSPVLQAASLTDTEKQSLILMREEEKLARDVYQALNVKWNHQRFANISKSEQQHMNEIKAVLDKYGIADPAAGKKQGEFTNRKFTELYAQLVQKGSTSLTNAFTVGIEIEKLDIADLKAALSKTTNTDVKNVYNNLLRGSENHLKAFSSPSGGNGPSAGPGPRNR
ncbi:MAG TPA: DUF2202 domain-containing protein [Syntrophorhabdaceae bacterium]|nr:DUF2202 domain-containing protein [Syntrophorhabdaceae bacterium]